MVPVELETLAHATAEVIKLRTGKTSHCILAARVLTSMLARRHDVRALFCEVTAANAAALALCADPSVQQLAPEALTVIWREHDAHIVSAGDADIQPMGRSGYNGHVVVIVDRQWLVDATLAQFARPSLPLTPAVFPIPKRAFLHGTYALQFESDTGVVLRYQARPGELSFRDTAAWRDSNIGALITAVEDAQSYRRQRVS